MAVNKLNLAYVRGIEDTAAIAEGLREYGCPESDAYGFLDVGHSERGSSVWGQLVMAKESVINKLNRQKNIVEEQHIIKDVIVPWKIIDAGGGNGVLEVYAGGKRVFEHIGAAFAIALGEPLTIDVPDIDVFDKMKSLEQDVKKPIVKSAVIKNYAHTEGVNGVFRAKFNSTEAHDFIDQLPSGSVVESMTVKFFALDKKASITIRNDSCYGFSCGEDDKMYVEGLIRELAGMAVKS